MRRVLLSLVALVVAVALYLGGSSLLAWPFSPPNAETVVSLAHPKNDISLGFSLALPTPTLAPFPTGTPAEPAATPSPPPGSTPASPTGQDAGDPDAILPSVSVAPGAEPQALTLNELPSDVTNILIMGSDRRVASDPGRTDVLLLVSVDRVHKTVRLLSIPRDLWVYIPGVGQNRVNTANVFGSWKKPGAGPQLVKDTFKHNLGLRVDRYVMIDFKDFTKIIDELGGVTVDVPCGLYDGTYIRLNPGRHTLNGEMALRYARSRYSTSDFSRAARQQQILRALWEQTPKSQIVLKAPQLWSTFRSAIETDLSMGEVMSLALFASQLKPEDMKSRVLTYPNVSAWMTPQGAAVLLLNQAGYRRMLAELFSLPSAAADPNAPVPAPQEALHGPRVAIWNGTTRRDLAELAAQSTRDATGIPIASTGMAFTADYPKTVMLDFGAPEPTVQALSKYFGVTPIKLPAQSDPEAAQVIVVVGADYKVCK